MSATGQRVIIIIIIGGGIGGLCLAQGLRQAGVPAAVYERDQAPDVRLPGYRLNIEPMGSRALHDCLLAQLWDLLVRTAGDSGPGMNVFTQRMRHLMRESGQSSPDPVEGVHAVSRATLRRVLLVGLADAVTFGKEFTGYERDGDRVTARFADGITADGTVLVGADDNGSRVRRQLLPMARVIKTGGLGIGGKLKLTEQAARWLPEPLTNAKNMIMPRRDFLFTAAFRRRVHPGTDHSGMGPGTYPPGSARPDRCRRRAARGRRAGLRHVGLRHQRSATVRHPPGGPRRGPPGGGRRPHQRLGPGGAG